jgi:hypothetical protein
MPRRPLRIFRRGRDKRHPKAFEKAGWSLPEDIVFAIDFCLRLCVSNLASFRCQQTHVLTSIVKETSALNNGYYPMPLVLSTSARLHQTEISQSSASSLFQESITCMGGVSCRRLRGCIEFWGRGVRGCFDAYIYICVCVCVCVHIMYVQCVTCVHIMYVQCVTHMLASAMQLKLHTPHTPMTHASCFCVRQ